MELSERILAVIAKLPPPLKRLLDGELSAGNKVIDMEVGRGEASGRTVLVLNHPFRTSPTSAPRGVLYREQLEREPKI